MAVKTDAEEHQRERAEAAHTRRARVPGRSIVKPPSATAANTSSASAATIR